ncbi:hypothetical protein MXE62_02770 [Staphylococcus haemolyticus]|uniref:hypothetical protein n=1 Tax=Staphylococcus haemolyticus TaxID=1283 RepID=UPI000CEB82B8|nr:hypothetical protein [Staphylococcus haemolyticus]AVH47466.1 hypothetical protein CWR44_09690 [Staphylococcus haemolyticus]MEB5827113.1 hypothetical protein [Staphylococcus haemolyticus]
MTNTINIKSIQENRDGSIEVLNQSTEVAIKPIRPVQFGKLTKVVNATIKDLQKNEDFKKTVQNLFGEYADGFTLVDLIRSEDFNVFNILDAVGFLLEETPERVFEIVSIMSGIDRTFVENQDMDTFFDLVEKVIEVNDIEKIVKRIQRLSSQMGKAFNFLIPQTDEQQQPKAVNNK